MLELVDIYCIIINEITTDLSPAPNGTMVEMGNKFIFFSNQTKVVPVRYRFWISFISSLSIGKLWRNCSIMQIFEHVITCNRPNV
jgi:hypothetical protein